MQKMLEMITHITCVFKSKNEHTSDMGDHLQHLLHKSKPYSQDSNSNKDISSRFHNYSYGSRENPTDSPQKSVYKENNKNDDGWKYSFLPLFI